MDHVEDQRSWNLYRQVSHIVNNHFEFKYFYVYEIMLKLFTYFFLPASAWIVRRKKAIEPNCGLNKNNCYERSYPFSCFISGKVLDFWL